MRLNIINKDIFKWSILRAGYCLDSFFNEFPKIKVKDWIDGTKKPTVKQLEEFSKKVSLPFGYFFLEKPPSVQELNLPLPYFRSNQNQVKQVSINLYDTVHTIINRQNWLREYLKDHEYDELEFVGSFNEITNVETIVHNIRSVLGLEENWAGKFKTWEESLNYLVEIIEKKGIIIVFNGVVGNNTNRVIDVKECRGFVLVDKHAPFMFINNSDSKSAQMFTIVHELAHIWTGNSAAFDFRKLQPAEDPIEKLCDQIAAEFLVPKESLNKIWKNFSEINQYCKYFKVSEIVIARRALDLKKITKEEFFHFYNECYKNNKVQAFRGGGDFYRTAKKRLSLTFLHHVNRAVKSRELFYRDAYKLTSMKGDTFEKFFRKYPV